MSLRVKVELVLFLQYLIDIVIETSGLALPQPLVQAFNWPEVKSKVTVDGVVTVVDTPAVAAGQFAANVAAVDAQRAADDNLDHESPLHELFEDQLSCADLIVLNKTDLVSRDAIEDVSALVEREKRQACRLVRAVDGNLPPSLIIGQGVGVEDDIANRKSHHDHEDHDEHDHDDFESFVVAFASMPEVDDVERRVAAMMRECEALRVKGFVAIDGKPMRLAVQAVGPRVETYFDRRWREGERPGSELVVIGLRGLDRARITEMLSGVMA